MKNYRSIDCKPTPVQQKSTNFPKTAKSGNLEKVNRHAAGIDVAAAELWVCVPPEATSDNVRTFGTFTSDLHAVAAWLEAHQVTTVAMESTGVYWIPLYQHLETAGFEVVLVNARQLKNVPGRTKTDHLDCRWIQKLHTFGLLHASFRPTDEVCQLRAILRYRAELITLAATHVQHLHQALRQMNILLDEVISDLTGVTGLAIIDAILKGERNPVVLAQLKYPHIRSDAATIAKALEGNYRQKLLFILEKARAQYRSTHTHIDDCDHRIQQMLTAWEKVIDDDAVPLPPPTRPPRKEANEPACDLRALFYDIIGVDLTAVPGLKIATIQTVIGEVGIDMSKWPTTKHFASWMGICPTPDISGGKVLSHKTKKVQSRAAKAFRMAANACRRSASALGAFFRRMKARHGDARAITATAHKLAVIFYRMVRDRVSYKELGEDYYEAQYRTRSLRHLERRAARLGFALIPHVAPATAAVNH